MPTVIPVKFAYATRELWFNPAQSGAVEGDHVICHTERGTEIGLATSDAYEVSEEELHRKTDGAALKKVIRVATDDDLDHAQRQALRGEDALPMFKKLVHESDLDMKPVGVEYLFGGEKVVCYFAAEERVDFRQLVRDLSRNLHERVDMRQIGVREEAAIMGGFAHCGQELCCSRFGSGFEPVSIRMAKEQDLPLNSNKISGACGRLMCCLRYEFEAYRDFKQRAPKKNAVIQTPLGTAKIIEYDTPKEQLCLRLESGKQVRVPLGEMLTSEAAHKKSEELGCPCRPDTVARDTLERLQSPEIRAALEELDRKNGVIPAETYEPDDLFVEERGGGRRRRNKGGNKGGNKQERQQAAKPQAASEQQEPAQRRRRRRKTVEIAEDGSQRLPGVAGPAANEAAPGEGRRSRRRRHLSEGDASRPDARSSEDAAPRAPERQQATERTEPAAKRRRRRRPGDKAGMGEQGEPREQRRPRERRGDEGRDQRATGQTGAQGARPRHMRDGSGDASATGEQRSGSEGAAKRRRRRHKRPGGEGSSSAE